MRVTGVSFSSDKKLARCEQQYSYRYDEKLKRRVKSKGLYVGDWMHQLLEEYRRKGDWKKKFVEVKKELWDKLFDEEKEGYEEDGFVPQVAYDLMDHYVETYDEEDKVYEPLHVEQYFELDLKVGFPFRWKSDYIARNTETGLTVLFENKNKKEIPDAKERILEGQVHSYCFLLYRKGIRIDRIMWDYIRTTPVPRPKILKDGSLSERKINTDQRNYLAALKEAKIHPKGDELIGLQNLLKTLPETLSLLRVGNKPNLKVGELFVRDAVERARRARSVSRPTRHWVRDCQWMCDYTQLCMADMTGKPDRNTIIKKDFIPLKKLTEKEEPNA